MMKTSTPFQHFNFTRAGTIAHACLAPDQRGSVLAAFSRAIYLQSESGELFWITALDEPMHRRCAQASSPIPRLSTGAGFQVQRQILIIDPCYSIDMGTAIVWHEPHHDGMVEPDFLYSRVRTFFATLDYSLARGFGRFIPFILALPQDAPSDLLPEPTDSVLLYARPFVMNMARACLEHQAASISKNTAPLIGLGTGLTPSGDDFLGGVYFALKMLQSNYPDMVSREYLPDLEPYRSRTHLISFTLLNDLVNGHAVAPFHHLIHGLVSGKPAESIYPFVSQLTRIGHSTGWDLLAGLLTGLLTTYRSHYFIPSIQLTKCMEV
jgi:hypothetical protein